MTPGAPVIVVGVNDDIEAGGGGRAASVAAAMLPEGTEAIPGAVMVAAGQAA